MTFQSSHNHRRSLRWCTCLAAWCTVWASAGCGKNPSSDGADTETATSVGLGSDTSSTPPPGSTDSAAMDSDRATASAQDSATGLPSDSATQPTGDTETVTDTIPAPSEWENSPGQPCVMYVHGGTGDDNDDGRSWRNAKQTLQSGIDAATGGGCTYWDVWVAQGTYYPQTPGDRFDATVQLRSRVTVYGGFLGYETERTQRNSQTNETIVSGNIGFPDMTEDNACHVVTGNLPMTSDLEPDMDDGSIDGFTIRDGYAIGCGVAYGAGLLNGIARNCVIADNWATLGGGAYRSIVENSVVRGNTAAEGAGMAEGIANDVVFEGNSATEGAGGGASHVTATRCTFRNNTAETGGGMFEGNATSCLFIENSATQQGGGAANTDVDASVFETNSATSGGGASAGQISDSYFLSNSAETGGGMYDGRSDTNIYAANTASVRGGAVSNLDSFHDTFVSNTAPQGGGAFQSEVQGAVLAGNTAAEGGAVHGGTVSGCTFVDNRATTAGASIFNGETVVNSIFETGTVVGAVSFCTEAASPAAIYAGYPLSQGQWTQVSFDNALHQTTLVTQAGWTAGHLAGQFVKLLGTTDAWREIAANTENSIVVKGDLTALVHEGDPFAVYDLYPKSDSPVIDAGTKTGYSGSDRRGTSRVDDYAVPNTGEGPPWVDQGAFEVDDGERFVDFSFPERAVKCESEDVETARNAINALYEKPEYTGCSETGNVRPESTQCVFRDRHFTEAFAPVHYCQPSKITVRRDMDESLFWQEALATMGDVFCDEDFSCGGADSMPIPNCSPINLPWCVENQCQYEKVCDCGDGTFYLMGLWCDGIQDCVTGADETGC